MPKVNSPANPLDVPRLQGNMLLDLRQSLRSLTRTPGLTATIILTVGLGIGATTAIFAVIHGVLLSPLPYSNPDRLVRIYTDAPPNRFRFSVADYLALEQQQTTFRQVAGYASTSMTFNDGEIAERVTGRAVSRSYFSLLGIAPRRGRDFDQSEGTPGGPHAAIVSYGFAWRHLGGDSAAIGRRIRLDGVAHTVVGVLPRVVGPLEGRTDVFTAAQWSTPPRRGPFTIIALGRLSQSGDTAAVTAELHAINRRIFPVWQSSYQDRKATWAIMDLKRFIIGDVGSTLAIVQGAVVFVLLIACTNAANLLVARVTRRRRELTVRSALGASHLRLIQHLISESAILALGGAVVAIAVAVGGIRLIKVAGVAVHPAKCGGRPHRSRDRIPRCRNGRGRTALRVDPRAARRGVQVRGDPAGRPIEHRPRRAATTAPSPRGGGVCGGDAASRRGRTSGREPGASSAGGPRNRPARHPYRRDPAAARAIHRLRPDRGILEGGERTHHGIAASTGTGVFGRQAGGRGWEREQLRFHG